MNAPVTQTPPRDRLAASRAALLAQLDAPPASPPLLATMARDHPWPLLGTAALAGALVVAVRPWRWLPRATVLVSLASQLAWQALATRRAGRISRAQPRAADSRDPRA